MAKHMCTYKYQSTPCTCVYVYWWWSSVKVLGQGNRENGVETLRNYGWLRYNIRLCLEIHVSDNLSRLKMHPIHPFPCKWRFLSPASIDFK